jgi:hypothetical protein
MEFAKQVQYFLTKSSPTLISKRNRIHAAETKPKMRKGKICEY